MRIRTVASYSCRGKFKFSMSTWKEEKIKFLTSFSPSKFQYRLILWISWISANFKEFSKLFCYLYYNANVMSHFQKPQFFVQKFNFKKNFHRNWIGFWIELYKKILNLKWQRTNEIWIFTHKLFTIGFLFNLLLVPFCIKT